MYDVIICTEDTKLPYLLIRVSFAFPMGNSNGVKYVTTYVMLWTHHGPLIR